MTQSYVHDSQAVAARAELAARAEQRERFALVSIGVGTLASGASMVGALAASGGFVDAPVTPTIITALVSFFVCAVSSTLIVLTAIGFARVAERASTVAGRAAIITGGVAVASGSSPCRYSSRCTASRRPLGSRRLPSSERPSCSPSERSPPGASALLAR